METSMPTATKPKSSNSKLNDAARLILSVAAERKDRLVFPLPESLATSGKEVEKIVKDLLTRKFIEECLAKLEDTIWRTDDQQRHLSLRVSSQGLGALGAHKTESSKQSIRTNLPAMARNSPLLPKASKAAQTRQKQATKSERILALLRRPQGATIAELIKSTGWQAHSIRGFLAGTLKRKMKLKLKSESPEGKERRYRVA
jgi:hypothetical protein